MCVCMRVCVVGGGGEGEENAPFFSEESPRFGGPKRFSCCLPLLQFLLAARRSQIIAVVAPWTGRFSLLIVLNAQV
jgi:hypothetical protein